MMVDVDITPERDYSGWVWLTGGGHDVIQLAACQLCLILKGLFIVTGAMARCRWEMELPQLAWEQASKAAIWCDVAALSGW